MQKKTKKIGIKTNLKKTENIIYHICNCKSFAIIRYSSLHLYNSMTSYIHFVTNNKFNNYYIER